MVQGSRGAPLEVIAASLQRERRRAGLSLAEAMADEPVNQIRVTGLGQRSVLPRGDNSSEPQQ